jgi:phage major head subunit gpT-like protein
VTNKRFKTGDRVVVVKPDGSAANDLISGVFTILDDQRPTPHCYTLDCSRSFRWRDSELELEAIYKSPLYQALL